MKIRSQVLGLLLSCFIMISCSGLSFAKPVSKEIARQAAELFLIHQKTLPEKIAPAEERYQYAKKASAELAVTRTRTIRDSYGKLLAYVHELNPEGFIITSADTKVRPVLGFSFKGKFPFTDTKHNVLLHLIKWDMTARLKVLDQPAQSTKSLVNANLARWENYTTNPSKALYVTSEIQEWGPWVPTNWHQYGHYNGKIPYQYPSLPNSERRPVGCSATGMSQIINYWHYPTSVHFDSGDSYNLGIDIDGDANMYGFPTFSELNNALTTINYNGNKEEEAFLNFAAGIKLKMKYGIYGSASRTRDVARVLKSEFFYGSAEADWWPTNWWRKRDNVIENIKKGWPIQMGIRESIWSYSGHDVIVDGFRASDEYFHVNLGVNMFVLGVTGLWYDLPLIDPHIKYPPYDWDVFHTLVHDIVPFQGWHQYGADQKNTFSAIYNAPTASSLANKWQITPLPNYKFVGLVVGYGAKIYATLAPNDLNQGYHPGLWVINQYSDVEEKYYITSEDEQITYPVQNSKGEVFVATTEGGIYRLDTVGKNLAKIYQNPSGQGFQSLKIDSDDYIYANSDTELVSLNSSGGWRWTFSTPSAAIMYRGWPAIDVSKDNVYIGYYNSAATTSYLGAINRQDGTLRYQKTFPNVEYSSRMTGVASISSGGTVYVGTRYKLYALTPGSSSFAEKWVKSVNSVIEEAPVIGKDGTLYFADWKQISGDWHPFLGAYNPSNGANKWEVTIPKNSDYDIPLQPYVANNDVVIFSVLRDKSGPDTFELYAYQDMGSYANQLWSKDFSTDSGSTVAFGPGETLYVLPAGAVGGMLYAVSEGDVGNPNGGGMGHTDNTAPGMPGSPFPLDGAADQATNLTLSWTAFDPDGHDLKYDLLISALVENEEASFVPVATQFTSGSYDVSGLTPGVECLWKVVATDGQSMSESPIWSFSTVNDPPSVVTVFPASASTGVAINTTITAEFSELLNASTINTNTFILDNSVTGTVSYDPATKIATFTPSTNLAYSSTYTATITTGVKDLLGLSMEADYIWSFTTGEEPDTVPPSVISAYPSSGDTNIPVNTAINATFSEDMDASSLTTTTFTVNESGSNIAGTITYSSPTVTFTPAYDLDYFTTYNVTITIGVKDLAGNNMTSDYSWSFTTIVSSNDSDGDGVPDNEDDHPNDASIATPQATTGTGKIIIDTSLNAGTNLTNVRTISASDPMLNLEGKPANYDFPDGLVSFNVNGLNPGDTVQVRITWPTPLRADAKYYKVDSNGFHEFAGAFISGNTVTLPLTDGGSGDGDGLANGEIVDPGGIALPKGNGSNISTSGGGGGGCFIKNIRVRPTHFTN